MLTQPFATRPHFQVSVIKFWHKFIKICIVLCYFPLLLVQKNWGAEGVTSLALTFLKLYHFILLLTYPFVYYAAHI